MALKEPTIQPAGELQFVGLGQFISLQDMQKIVGQWERFMSEFYPRIDNKLAEPPVGITMQTKEDGIEYFCATGVSKFGETPSGCSDLLLKPATYAVFVHDGNVSQVPETYAEIWSGWFPKSGKVPAKAPGFERHNETFDPRSGNGGVTIWLPIEA
jgi:AraC family transcriptional regulator